MLIAFASLLLNGLVLFLVARPARAFLLVGVYVASIVSLFVASSASGNGALFTTAMCAVILGPACIASIEYYRHSAALRQQPVVTLTSPSPSATYVTQVTASSEFRFQETRELKSLRNQIEISIFHHTDRIELLAKVTYFAAALQAILAALDEAWLDLSTSPLLITLAYTIKAGESRVAALIYTLFGAFVAVQFTRRATPAASVGVPILIIILGLSFSATSFSLARLRRVRERIPLEPAAHLQDP